MKAFKHPLDIPISEVKQAMAEVVKPFRATLQDTTNVRYPIEVHVEPVGIDLQQGKVELEITFTDLKSLSWYKARVMGDGRNMLNYRKNFFKYWFLLQDGLGQFVDKDASEANQRFEVGFSSRESATENYSESNNNLIREIMGMAFEFLCNYTQFSRTIHGLRFEAINQNAKRLYLLKRYFHRKNLLHVNQLFMVQQITIFEPEASSVGLPQEEHFDFSKYGYMWNFQELFKLRANIVENKHFSRSTTRRREKLIPVQHNMMTKYQDSDDDYTQSNFSSVAKKEKVFSVLKSSKLITTGRDSKRASISKRGAIFANASPGIFESEASRSKRWNEIVTHQATDSILLGRLIDIPKPLMTIWVRYEGIYYLVTLRLGSVVKDEEPDLISTKFRRFNLPKMQSKTSLENESPRNNDESMIKQSFSYSIEDFFAELNVLSRTNEKVFTEKVTLDKLPEYLEIQLDDLKNYVIKRCTSSIIPPSLLERIQKSLVSLAGKQL